MISSLFLKVRKCRNQFKCNYLGNKKLFLKFLLVWWNLDQSLTVFKKKMTLIAYGFPKLQTAKNLVRPVSRKSRLRTPFDSQYVKGAQALAKSAWQHFYQISSSLWAKLTWKRSLLVICEMTDHFVNTVTADNMYSPPKSEHLPQPI